MGTLRWAHCRRKRSRYWETSHCKTESTGCLPHTQAHTHTHTHKHARTRKQAGTHTQTHRLSQTTAGRMRERASQGGWFSCEPGGRVSCEPGGGCPTVRLRVRRGVLRTGRGTIRPMSECDQGCVSPTASVRAQGPMSMVNSKLVRAQGATPQQPCELKTPTPTMSCQPHRERASSRRKLHREQVVGILASVDQ